MIDDTGANAEGKAFKADWQQQQHLIFWRIHKQNFSFACLYKESLTLW